MSDAVIDWSLTLNLLRHRSGVSLSRWSKKLQIHLHTLSNLASGAVMSPRFDTGMRILDACADYLTDADWARIRATAGGWLNDAR